MPHHHQKKDLIDTKPDMVVTTYFSLSPQETEIDRLRVQGQLGLKKKNPYLKNKTDKNNNNNRQHSKSQGTKTRRVREGRVWRGGELRLPVQAVST